MKDGFGRQIDYLRISITDRCNLRCVYCRPVQDFRLLRHEDILSFEEITEVARVAARLSLSCGATSFVSSSFWRIFRGSKN
jgi:cyclic pyranopterin phosphate synthase